MEAPRIAHLARRSSSSPILTTRRGRARAATGAAPSESTPISVSTVPSTTSLTASRLRSMPTSPLTSPSPSIPDIMSSQDPRDETLVPFWKVDSENMADWKLMTYISKKYFKGDNLISMAQIKEYYAKEVKNNDSDSMKAINALGLLEDVMIAIDKPTSYHLLSYLNRPLNQAKALMLGLLWRWSGE